MTGPEIWCVLTSHPQTSDSSLILSHQHTNLCHLLWQHGHCLLPHWLNYFKHTANTPAIMENFYLNWLQQDSWIGELYVCLINELEDMGGLQATPNLHPLLASLLGSGLSNQWGHFTACWIQRKKTTGYFILENVCSSVKRSRKKKILEGGSLLKKFSEKSLVKRREKRGEILRTRRIRGRKYWMWEDMRKMEKGGRGENR